MDWGLGIGSQNTAPPEWANIIQTLSSLPNLVCLRLTFPGTEEHQTDLVTIAVARKMLQSSKVKGDKKLSIRRTIAPHYTNDYEEDSIHSDRTEVFN